MLKSTLKAQVAFGSCLFAMLGALALPQNALGVDLLAYYEFEGNYADSSGMGTVAGPSQNVGLVNFTGGFRGQAVDLDDTDGSGNGNNSGGTVDVAVNVSPPPNYSFGGWFNLDNAAGFRGVVANDNGGWDRGIHLNTGAWGLASGGGSPLNGVAPATPGSWQYVVGTFDGTSATLYVGDTTAATQTTASGSKADNAANLGGLGVLELGRYDNQELDAQVDDFFVFNDALTVEQANAVRNLRLATGLDYTPAEAEQLFDLFDAGSGTVTINGKTWALTGGLSGNPGEVGQGIHGGSTLLLDVGAGTGLATIPEPTSALLAGLALLGAAGATGRGRRSRKA